MGLEGYKEDIETMRDRVGNTQDHMDREIDDLMNEEYQRASGIYRQIIGHGN